MQIASDVTEDWRRKNEIPGSDDIEVYREELKSNRSKGKKCPRSQSMVVVERGAKAARLR